MASVDASRATSRPNRFLVVSHVDSDAANDSSDADPDSILGSAAKQSAEANEKAEPRAFTPKSKRRNFFLDIRDVYAAYQPSEVLGQNIFKSNLYNDIKHSVLASKAVEEAIRQHSSKNPTMPMSRVRDLANGIANRLMSAPKDKVVRAMVITVQKILQRLYKTINVLDTQMQELKRVAAEAAKRRVPLVFLPSHKSHVDYLVVSWLLFHMGISIPFVASGDNLLIPIVGAFLRSSGAYFIRRSFGGDDLYRAILTEYMTALMERGYNLEFFIEGGRSRSGKLLTPKMGLISVITEAYFAGRISDAYLVPISIGYEKVIETEGYIQELLGKSKQPENLVQVIQAVELLKLNFGSIELRFGSQTIVETSFASSAYVTFFTDKPFSIKSFVDSQIEARNLRLFESPSDDQQTRDIIHRDRRQLVNILSYNVGFQINQVSVALPTSLIVTVLLTHHGRGIPKSLLVEKVRWLKEQVQKRGGHVGAHTEDLGKIVDQVTFLLGSSIERHSNLLEPIFTPTKRFELSYYRNQIIHLFVPEAIVACAVYPFRQRRKINHIPKIELESAAQYLSRLLKWEFIFRSSPDFAENLTNTLEWMRSQAIVSFEAHSQLVSVLPAGEGMFHFLCFLLWPFIENYWMVSASLFALWPDKMVEETDFLTNIQKFAATLYYEGELAFFESISKEMIKSALTRFIERQVIIRQPVNSKTTIIKLTPQYAKNHDKLSSLVQKIGDFRRHGKYSKEDPASERILKLARMLTPYFPSSSPAPKAKL